MTNEPRSLLDHVTQQILDLAHHDNDLALWAAMCIEDADYTATLYTDDDGLIAALLIPPRPHENDWTQVARIPVHLIEGWTWQDTVNIAVQLAGPPDDPSGLEP